MARSALRRLPVDFNSIKDDHVCALAEYAGNPPAEVGDRVLAMQDDEGAEGTVDRIENRLIYVAVDWSTWGEH